MSAQRRVAVIGAGVSGLLAALRLRQLGADVTVFEASERAGGVLQTVERNGWLAERGPNAFNEPQSDVRLLLDEIGLAEIQIRPAPNTRLRYLLHLGTPVPIPSRVADLVSSPLLSLSGRMRLLKEPFIPADVSDDEETVDHFVRRRLGADVADHIIDPYLAGTSGGDPRQLLVRYVLPKLVEFERSAGSILKGAMRARRNARRRGTDGGTWSCRHGMGELVDRIAASFGPALHTNAVVEGLVPSPHGITVTVQGTQPANFSGVVVAVPAPALRHMGDGFPSSKEWSQIAAMPQGAMAVAALGFRRADVGHSLDGAGLSIATTEKRRILGVIFASSLWEGRAPADHVLLTVNIGGGRQPELVDQADDALLRMVLDELRDILQVRGTPVFQDVFRWHGCMPQMVAGHAARLAAADAIEHTTPGVVLTGAWRDGVALGEAMHGGVRAADRLMNAER